MGNYRFDDDLHKEKQLPAGWRGIGCLLMILLPIVSYVAAMEVIKITTVRNFVYRVSPSLLGPPSLPSVLWKIDSPPLLAALNTIYSWNNLEANILLASLILLVLSGFIGFFYALVYRTVSPSRYGPQDAPPPKHKPKKYKR